MANEKNLIPMNQRTESEKREITRKAGIASGAARRRKKELKEAADLFLSLKATPEMRAKLKKYGISAKDADMQMAMIAEQTMQAIKGNTKAAMFIASLLQEGQQEKTEVNRADMEDVAAYIRRVKDADKE